jgi:phosphatidylglycerophosphate synthase
MLDGWARRLIDPALERAARSLAASGLSANAVTFAACAIGLASAVAISLQWYLAGLVLMLLSRIGDGLDGAVAKIAGKTDLGGYLDIVLDFLFYGVIPVAFVLADPAANAVAGAVLVFSFYVNGASFLAFAAIAAKRNMASEARGPKSLFFTTGLAEATETIAVFAAFCLVPHWFPELAYAFAALTFYTALSRIVLAARTFGRKSE